MNWKEDKNTLVCGFFVIFFSVVVLGISLIRPNDGQTYQTFVSMLSGFGGALLLDMKDKVKVTPGEEKKDV